ncbi:dTMP kinase [bacterium]|nr:dTMP kinase [bacterium]
MEKLLISLEGIDGSGKSTQLDLLSKMLQSQGRNPLILREPGGTTLGERVRGILLDGSVERSAIAELLLFCSARAELIRRVILPTLDEGRVVILDRFIDSTRAYQGYGLGLGATVIDAALRIATGGLTPALTILLDIEATTGLRRAASASNGVADAIEGRELAFMERVRQGYLALAEREPERFLTIPATKPHEEIAQQINERVLKLLNS